ncbi:hypothetical protein DM860_008534 [Cuscuta australis]|uniref:DUF4378 domain-containing protein n=1 Tax=Cuscuta australis TaxID=267555 RepID=A0A328D5L6_9ASTE|nr:hypothetical protein DM860_008534 [Cuscuta australis]
MSGRNDEVNKQIGCMNGIFHIFERHHFRRLGRHATKRLLPPGASHMEESASEQQSLGKNTKVSKESSKILLPLLDQTQTSHQRDLKDAVKDSMHREARSLSIKTVTKTEGKVRVVKRVDSPRPSQEGLTRGPTKVHEPRRLSYDERESGRETLKRVMKLKEIPRLSLDSRVKSIENCSTTASESRSNFLLVGNHHHQQHKRSSSVVAKLMGLEEASYTTHVPESATSAAKVVPRQRQSSVYSEIEKRVAELEFQESGKDLRALKHILEAIHRSEKPEPATLQKNIRKSDKLNENNKVRLERNREDSLGNERKSLSPRRRNYIKDPGQRLSGAKSNVQVGSVGAVSPRLQSHRPPPEMSRVRRTQNAQQTKELGLQSRRYKNNKLKSRNPQQDFSGEIKSDIRNFGEQCDTASVHSESDNGFASPMDTELLTGKYRSKGRKFCKELDCSRRLVENMLTAELQISTKEQRSPVSVLDETFYIEDSPSPVKKISATYTEYDDSDDNEAEWNSKEFGNSPFTTTRQHRGSEINHEKSEEDEILLQHNLRLTNSTSTADQTESFCHNSNEDADHKYVNKILLASGILRDVSRASTITWLHPTVHLINPELFDVLEQTEELQTEGPTKELPHLKFDQKTHRKIVFDTVKEIIVQKLSPEEGLSMRGGRRLSGHQLLKEVHREMDYLRPAKPDSSLDAEKDELVSIINADLKHESEEWVESHCEIPTLVVDIERLIFKELITEIISDEAARLKDRSMRHCRQLFS